MATPGRNLFDAGSVPDNYRRYLEPVLFAPWAERFVAWAGVRAGDVVLDLAAGTGVVSRVAARASGSTGRVIANDVSAGMLEQAARAREPRAAVMVPLLGAASSLDLPDASVDVVLCQQGLQFMRHPGVVLAECARVLRAGGTLAVSVWADDEPLEPFDSYAEAVERDNHTVVTPVHGIIDRLVGAGLTEVTVTRHSLVVRWPTLEAEVAGIFGTPFGPMVEAMTPARRDAVVSLLRERLGAPGGRTRDHRTTAVFGRGIR